MAITIDREQRDAIYEEVLTDLTGSGDIWADIQYGDYEAARRTRDRFAADMRLLDVLGWEPDTDRELFELTLDQATLARALRTLNENARSTLSEHILKPIEEADLTQRALTVQTACGAILAQLADTEARQRNDG